MLTTHPGPGNSFTRAAWHPELNQILVGTSSGQAYVYYDLVHSKKGALLAISKQAKRVDTNDFMIAPMVATVEDGVSELFLIFICFVGFC